MQRRRVSGKKGPRSGSARSGRLPGRPDLPAQQHDPTQLDQGNRPTHTPPADGGISFILPTIGRRTLQAVVSQLREEIEARDEVIVVGDGDQPVARGICSIPDARFKYFEFTDGTGGKGNAQRDYGIAKASKQWLMFIDDDDMYMPDAIREIVHPALDAAPNVPHIFKMYGGPSGDPVEFRNIAGPMFVVPNNRTKLADWNGPENPTVADWFFIRNTLNLHDGQVVYHPEPVYIVRPGQDCYMNFGMPKSLLARLV